MYSILKEYSTFFLKIGSFYYSPRVKQLGFTIFECIQPFFLYLEELKSMRLETVRLLIFF